MVPLSSHSFKQWGQLGEILGGVRFPECGAHRSLADRPAWGSSVEYRQKFLILEAMEVACNVVEQAKASPTKLGGLYFCGIKVQ